VIFPRLNHNRPMVSALLVLFASLALQMPALADSNAGNAEDKSSSSSTSTPSSTVPSNKDPNAKEKLEVLSLNDLNDTAILLSFIKEQSINIYEEAARLPAGVDASSEYKPLSSIPVNYKNKSFLPARQQWLVFYLGIMEPVIREISKDAKEIESGSKQLIIPKSMQAVLNPAWDGWSQNTKEMNKHLDELLPMFDGNPPNNSDIQNKAVQIYNDVEQLEKIRKNIFACVKDNLKAGGKEKILVSPF
jgi:hypothetical protein